MVKNILVIQLTKMGDFLQTIPLLHRIKIKHPKVNLSVLVDAKCVEVSSGVSFIDEVIPLDLTSMHHSVNSSQYSLFEKYDYLNGLLSDLKGRPFDLIYNINFSKIPALLCQFFENSQIIGYRLEPRNHSLIGERWASFIFHLMRYRRIMRINLVDLWANYENGDHALSSSLFFHTNGTENIPIKLLASSDSLVIGLQMGCGGRLRQWPTEYFADLAYKLVKDLGARVVLFGSKAERHLTKQFQDEWRSLAGRRPVPEEVTDLIGKTTISQLASVLIKCHVLIGGDTGTIHLATAVGTRVVALFMGTAFGPQTGPYGDDHYVLQALMPCSPCNEGSSSCQEAHCRRIINPEMVYALVSHILQGKNGDNINDSTFSACLDGVCRDSPCGYPVLDRDKPCPYDKLNMDRDKPCPYDKLNSGYVQIYQTRMDNWGVKFLPLVERELDIEEIMAVAYREVGRKLMRPTYNINPQDIIDELSSQYGDITADTGEKVKLILRNLSGLHSICESGAKQSAHISWSDLEVKIQESCGSLDVLAPLGGYFSDLKAETESRVGKNTSTATHQACKAILSPVKELLELIREISSALPHIVGH